MKALRKGTLAACAALILLLCGTVSLFSQNTATAGDWDAYASIVEEINGKYGTEITLHNIPQTRTPEEFKAWLTKLAEADARASVSVQSGQKNRVQTASSASLS